MALPPKATPQSYRDEQHVQIDVINTPVPVEGDFLTNEQLRSEPVDVAIDGSVEVEFDPAAVMKATVENWPDPQNVLVTGQPIDVEVQNFPATQVVSGSVEVSNDAGNPLPVSGSVSISNFPALQTISGSVSVSNFPAVQPVSGTFWQATQPVSIAATVTTADSRLPATLGQKTMANSLPVVLASDQSSLGVTGTFWQATQPVSAASLPLPSGAATETTLAAISAKLPSTIGQKTMSGSLAVVLASDQLPLSTQPLPALPTTPFNYYADLVSTTTPSTVAAAVSGQRNYITSLSFQCITLTGTDVTIAAGATTKFKISIPGTGSLATPFAIMFPTPLFSGVNEAFTATCSTALATIRVTGQGYTK